MKKNLYMSLILVVITVLLCGCGIDKKNIDVNKNLVREGIEGLYVSDSDVVEAVFVKKIDKKYALVFKVDGMSYYDLRDYVSDDEINGFMDEDTYKISVDGNNIKLDFSRENVKDLSLKRYISKDTSGVYQENNRFLAIYRNKDKEVKSFYFDVDNYKYAFLSPTSSEVGRKTAYIKSDKKNVTLTLKRDKKNNKFVVSFNGSNQDWVVVPGDY